MASSAVKDSSEEGVVSKVVADIEDEEELFEINLEAVDCIPPPHYWESYFTATDSALLANCLLPIADVSSAIPTVLNSKACNMFQMEGMSNFLMVGESSPGKFLGIQYMGAFGLQHKEMRGMI